MFNDAVKEINFLFKKKAGYHRQKSANAYDGCMCTVGYAESIVNSQIASFDKCFGKIRIILFFFLMES